MSKRTEVVCDRCGREIIDYDIKMSSARLNVWAVGIHRSYSGQRIDLCQGCYEQFVNFMEGANDGT